jgi:hypothetical protein
MESDPHQRKSSRTALTLAALGVVYGDIGTSPLYAVKETFNPDHGIPLNAENVLGGLSTIFWALMIVVSLKYAILIMRADNKGEGGIMALLALASSAVKDHPQSSAQPLENRLMSQTFQLDHWLFRAGSSTFHSTPGRKSAQRSPLPQELWLRLGALPSGISRMRRAPRQPACHL